MRITHFGVGLRDPGPQIRGVFGFVASPCPGCARDSLPVWKGCFCGLARSLARDYGAPSRLLVNRDAAFLGLLGLALDHRPPEWRERTCCNPFARPFPVDDSHPAIRHAAAASLCGLAIKLRDDADDEGRLRRGLSRALGGLIGPAVDRATQELNGRGFPTHAVLQRLHSQKDLENRLPERADEPTAFAFGQLVAHLSVVLKRPELRPALQTIGAAHGRLVYWRDAWDDLDADQRRGRFNPFLQLTPTSATQCISGAWTEFATGLQKLPTTRFKPLIDQLLDATGTRHAGFLSTPANPGLRRKKQQRRQKRTDHNPCDWCHGCDGGCCPSGHSTRGCNRACDCGPGDSGCCDCCPCDGCGH